MINKPSKWLIALVIAILTLLIAFRISEDRKNSIHNPDNQPFVLETAFNLGIDVDEVTQEQFNERYLK